MAKQGRLLGIFMGLADLRASLVDHSGILGRLQREALRKALRVAGFAALEHWHKNFLPRHFRKTALFEYAPYAQYYSGLRRQLRRKTNRVPVLQTREKLPLVDSGSLRDRVMQPVARGRDFRGTAKSTTLTLRYGRPRGIEARANKEIARLVEKYGMTSKAAAAKVFRHMGYTPAIRQRFERLIPFMSEREKTTLREVFKKELLAVLAGKNVSISGITD